MCMKRWLREGRRKWTLPHRTLRYLLEGCREGQVMSWCVRMRDLPKSPLQRCKTCIPVDWHQAGVFPLYTVTASLNKHKPDTASDWLAECGTLIISHSLRLWAGIKTDDNPLNFRWESFTQSATSAVISMSRQQSHFSLKITERPTRSTHVTSVWLTTRTRWVILIWSCGQTQEPTSRRVGDRLPSTFACVLCLNTGQNISQHPFHWSDQETEAHRGVVACFRFQSR
jgi:hypothetical protein